ncbi:cadherin domain-containing protein [Stieleria varia]|uniref:Cadherin domain protein n=1 Tax=Stieleria varia TaxID=2528005 RepID=A0A5C6B6B9_9BACT|nr:cadherin domain-containing protein [Stieleria varia]TWU07500.1 Cadherin domain protein [Stieleria varia]
MHRSIKPSKRKLSIERLDDRRVLAALVDGIGPGDHSTAAGPGASDNFECGLFGAFGLQCEQDRTENPPPKEKEFVVFEDFDEEEIDEEKPVIRPSMVTGSFLWGAADARVSRQAALSFDDIQQGRSDTCSFSSALASVARTNFNLASGIRLAEILGDSQYIFQVRLYREVNNVFEPTWIDVPFDETLEPDDLKSTDRGEFWPALYLRAYLTFSDAVDGNYRSMHESMRALTGLGHTRLTPDGSVAQAQQMLNALENGSPIMTATRNDSGDFLLETTYGLVNNHAYTVMGVEINSSSPDGIFVTIRNPWARDTSYSFYDADGDGNVSLGESYDAQYGIDGRNDGIIRVPWPVFSQQFDDIVISDLTGPNINEVQEPTRQLVFDQPEIDPVTIGTGEELAISFHATDPQGGYPLYGLHTESPGYIHPQSGEFRWRPKSTDAGTWVVTVDAEVNPFVTGAVTFVVNVESQTPTVDSLASSQTSIQSNGQDELTLTAAGVSTIADLAVDVEFWRDADGNGTFSSRHDVFLGSDGADEGKFEWNGYVSGLSAGNQVFFARPKVSTFDDTIYGDGVAVDVLITQSLQEDPVALPVGNPIFYPIQLPSNTVRYRQPLPQGGQRAIFSTNDSNAEFGFFDLQGAIIPGTQKRLLDPGEELLDVAFLDDGQFAVLYSRDNGPYGQWFDVQGNPLGDAVGYDNTYHNLSTPSNHRSNSDIAVASFDGEMHAIVVFATGAFLEEDVFSFTFSRGESNTSDTQITKSLWQVSEGTAAGNRLPRVTMNEVGFGVVVWLDSASGDTFDARRARGLEFSDYGRQFIDPEFEIGNANNPEIAPAVSMNRNRDFVVSYSEFEFPSDGTGDDVQARFFRHAANPGDRIGEDEPFQVNSFVGGNQFSGSVAMSNSGWSAIVWSSWGQDAGDASFETGVYAQLYNPQGRPAGPEFQVPIATEGNQRLVSVEIDDDADLFISYHDFETESRYLRLYSTNVAPSLDTQNPFSVSENSPVGTMVTTLMANDLDGDNVRFAIVGDSPFAVDEITGELTVVDPTALDRETNAEIQVAVQLTDDADDPKSVVVTATVNVTEVNEGPVSENVTFTINELSPVGHVVGTVPAFDPDEQESLIFSIQEETPFGINARSGQLFVVDQTALDFETTPSFQFDVVVTDGNDQQTTATVTVELTDVDETTINVAPKLVELPAAVFYIDGQAASLVFPNVLVEDPDASDYTGGRLRAENISFPWDDDRLVFQELGGVSLSGDSVQVDGVLIGQITRDGLGRNALQVVFNSDATPERLTRLIRSIAFQTPNQDRPSDSRVFRLTLADTDGNTTSVTTFAAVRNASDQPGGLFESIGTDANDVFNLESFAAGQNSVNGKLGVDTLRITGGGQSLDLTSIANAILTDVEVLDIRGSGGNQLTLNLDEVLNLSATSDTVQIHHDADDTITIGDGWNVEAPVLSGGSFWHVLTQDTATLRIANAKPFSNPFLAMDVNHDDRVSALDALDIINRLALIPRDSSERRERLSTPTDQSELAGFYYFDSNEDDFVSALDALFVINRLAETRTEGERIDVPLGNVSLPISSKSTDHAIEDRRVTEQMMLGDIDRFAPPVTPAVPSWRTQQNLSAIDQIMQSDDDASPTEEAIATLSAKLDPLSQPLS